MEANNYLVSIIVPVFNCQKYLSKCLQSIRAQSHTNIEIVVVDDGSTDGSSQTILEEKEKDSRIKMIRQSNRGVSSARNSGLHEASGDYVVFVDGDDFLSEDCIDYLLEVILSTKTSFAFSRNCYSSKAESQVLKDNVVRLSNEEGAALLLSPKVIVGCWNKIYKKSYLLERSLCFREDLFYGEGLNFIVRCALFSDGVGVGMKRVYFYRRNNNSSATTKFNFQKYVNGEKSLDAIYELIKDGKEAILTAFFLHKALFVLGAKLNCIENGLPRKNRSQYQYWRNQLPALYAKIAHKKEVRFSYKIAIFFGLLCPRILTFFFFSRRNKKAKMSID